LLKPGDASPGVEFRGLIGVAMGIVTKRWAIAMMLAVSIAGCSKIERIEDVVAFADRAADVNEQRVRVLGDPILGIPELPATAFEAIPEAGSATYLGTAFLSIRNSAHRLDADALVGDTRLVIDFAAPNNAVVGAVTNLRRTRINDVSVSVPGRLDFDAGVIGSEQPNDLAFDFAGSLSYDGTDFGLQGRLDGKLRGTRTEIGPDESAVRAYSVRDDDIGITASTGAYTASMTVIGEN
jgi:hypothetical protein